MIREHRGVFDVETEHGTVVCTLRSKLKKSLIYPERDDNRHTVDTVEPIGVVSPVVIGDRVRIERSQDNTGAIEEVLPRRTKLSRAAPGRRGVEQVIIANADHLFIIFAVKNPVPHLQLLDRLLIAAEVGQLTPIICLNKMDLWHPGLPDIRARYVQIGYRVISTSAQTDQGINELGEAFRNRLSVIAGPSGVGKTSLLNLLQPGLGLKVREVSRATGQGRHATSYLAAHKLDRGGMVIDTPGVREFRLWEIKPDELPFWFPEMRPYLERCRFVDCAHIHEPDCAIKDAIASGAISPERHNSYVHLREGLS